MGFYKTIGRDSQGSIFKVKVKDSDEVDSKIVKFAWQNILKQLNDILKI